MEKFDRCIENLIANFKFIPEDHNRSILRPAKKVNYLIDKLIQSFNTDKKKYSKNITNHWIYIIGKENIKKCYPEKILNNKLVIKVNSAPLRTNLIMQNNYILKRLQKIKGCNTIKAIVWR